MNVSTRSSTENYASGGILKCERDTVQELLADLPVALIVVAGSSVYDAVVVGCNPAAAAALECSLPAGSRFYDAIAGIEILSPDSMERLQVNEWPFSRALGAGETVADQELHIRTRSGTCRVLLVSVRPVHDENVCGAVIALKDITDRVAVNRATDHFLAVLSHELRTPLMPVFASITLLERDDSFPAHLRRRVEVMRRNLELQVRLIDDLLDLTRIHCGKVELAKRRVRLETVVERAVEVCRAEMESRGIQLVLDAAAPQLVVEVDPLRIEQVLWNLLKNAIKFSPVGSSVVLSWQRHGGDVVIEVKDSGMGICPSDLDRIFDAFAQGERAVTRQFGGLGLGLALCKSLVEMHAGTIEAHSEGRGKGATFRVRLPIADDVVRVAEREGPPAEPRSAPAAGKLSILLVEDNDDTAEAMASLLEQESCSVEAVADVATALRAAIEHEFHLVIVDLGLPDRSGLDLVRQLRARGRRTPCIAVSGHGQGNDILRSGACGFQAHLIKPVDFGRLMETINTVFSR